MDWEILKKVIGQSKFNKQELFDAQDDLAKELEVAISADDSELQKWLAETGRQIRLQAQQACPVDAEQAKMDILRRIREEEIRATRGDGNKELNKPVEKFAFTKGISKKEDNQ